MSVPLLRLLICARFFTLFCATTILLGNMEESRVFAVIEEGLHVGIRDFAVLPNTGSGNDAPARMKLMTSDPLGRLFVNDQRGPLYLVSSDGSTVTNYLDLSTFSGMDLVDSFEQGFHSFAFHPDFANSGADGFGKFYTMHSTTDRAPAPTYPFVSNTGAGSFNTHDAVLFEWTVSNPNASTYSAGGGGAPREVFRLEQPRANHNAGLIAFNTSVGSGDADYGNLYISIGDGGSANDPWNIASDPSNPYGAILRIDPLDPVGPADYSIVTENVFASDGDSNTLAEIYSYGLRHPQRFGWDNLTGDLFTADIGQDAWEEINLLSNGGNFGWDPEEGNASPIDASLRDPIAKYNHSGDLPLPPVSPLTGGRAITMGEVVRGSGVPGLNGLLLAADFPTGAPLYIDVSGGVPAERSGVDPFSELIFVDVDGSGTTVDLLEIVNDTRNSNGIADSDRADPRWSFGVDGRVFLTNKKDGVIREIVAIQPGDFDFDNDADAHDFLTWQRGESPRPFSAADLAAWEAAYDSAIVGNTSAVPEPGTVLLFVQMGIIASTVRRRPSGRRR